MNRFPSTLLLTPLLCAAVTTAQTSPFEMVRWQGQVPEVKVGGNWYRLAAIDKVRTDAILAHARKTYRDRWAKRFCEDLVDVLAGMGHRPGATVRLELADLTSGKVRVLDAVAMTGANRQAIWRASPRPNPAGWKPAAKGRGGPAPAVADTRQASPFQMVRFSGTTPEVQLGDRWFGLYAIDRTTTDELLQFCRRRYEERWGERFCEDLPQAFAAMGRPLGDRVRLELVDLETRKTVLREAVPLTRGNRQAILRAEPHENLVPPRSERGGKGSTGDRSQFHFLTQRFPGTGGPKLDAAAAAADLDELEWLLEQRFSYLSRRGFDYRTALDTIRAGLGAGIGRDDFHIQLRQLVAGFGDGHARVAGVASRLPRGYAPFLVHGLGDRIVALSTAGKGPTLLDAKHPYLAAIDGKPIAACLAATARLNTDGSPQLSRRMAIENLAFLNWTRQALDIPTPATTVVTLHSADGKSQVERRLPVAARPSFARNRPQEFRIREDGFAYLRLDTMASGPAFSTFLHQSMAAARSSSGLILDVRGNGGGSRDALRILLPYLMKKDDPPRVVNIATYRIPPEAPIDRTEGYLDNRFLYPKTSRRWSETDLAAITAVTRDLRPTWTPRGGNSSPLHFMLIGPSADPRVYHFRKPVVVLIDSGCFSATDIFVGGLQGWRNVTLVGTATGGGSGRSKTNVLHHSGLRVRLSTMVSYRPDGRLYDGAGIAPDVVVEPSLADVLGQGDSVLAKGIEVLRRK